MHLPGDLNSRTLKATKDLLLICCIGHSGSTPDLLHRTQWIHS